jgi:CHAD domain-containing protein
LTEHLAKMRQKSARKLHDVISRRRREARKRLKRSSKLFKKALKEDSNGMNGESAPQILMTELSHWPQLDESNLHTFRIRIKELRYMLQLGDEADAKLIDKLGQVKDTIGEWHDWVELLKIARKVLDTDPDVGILRNIKKIGKEKFHLALAAGGEVRELYFAPGTDAKGGRKIIQIAAGF